MQPSRKRKSVWCSWVLPLVEARAVLGLSLRLIELPEPGPGPGPSPSPSPAATQCYFLMSPYDFRAWYCSSAADLAAPHAAGPPYLRGRGPSMGRAAQLLNTNCRFQINLGTGTYASGASVRSAAPRHRANPGGAGARSDPARAFGSVRCGYDSRCTTRQGSWRR